MNAKINCFSGLYCRLGHVALFNFALGNQGDIGGTWQYIWQFSWCFSATARPFIG